ncbi:MAG TPA: (deoxy)nucleoside triphosphate pyrophosphohydrolase [Chitinispirillaceae bacterium]|nr:(deoxy)nucleoside triphosphate pyrophosphohydrolase [Chitinispirillaceae bacterium]
MNHLHVTCGIIEQDGYVLATQRSSTMSMPLKWEFPGGKINEGESLEECLKRELLEELTIQVEITSILPESDYLYPAFKITLYPFLCIIQSGTIELKEHADYVWLLPKDLPTLDWAEADVAVVREYCNKVSFR